MKQQEYLAAERVRDKERREKSRSETKRLRLKAKLRMREQRNKIKERDEKDEMLQKRKGLLKRKSTLKKKNREIEVLKKQIGELTAEMDDMKADNRRTTKSLIASLTPRSNMRNLGSSV